MTFQRCSMTERCKELNDGRRRPEKRELPEHYYNTTRVKMKKTLSNCALFRDDVFVKERSGGIVYRVVIASWHIFGRVSKAQVELPEDDDESGG